MALRRERLGHEARRFDHHPVHRHLVADRPYIAGLVRVVRRERLVAIGPNGASTSSMVLANEKPMSALLAPMISGTLALRPGAVGIVRRLDHDLAVDHRSADVGAAAAPMRRHVQAVHHLVGRQLAQRRQRRARRRLRCRCSWRRRRRSTRPTAARSECPHCIRRISSRPERPPPDSTIALLQQALRHRATSASCAPTCHRRTRRTR